MIKRLLVLSTLIFFFANTQAHASEKALYLSAEGYRHVVSASQYVGDFFSFIEAPYGNADQKFSKIYFCINDAHSTELLLENTGMRQSFLSELHMRNMQAECVIDFTQWIDESQHNAGLAYLSQVVEFNALTSNPDEKFDAVQLVAHPETLMEELPFGTVESPQVAAVWNNYLVFLQKAHQLISSYNTASVAPLSFTVALSAGYDTDAYLATHYALPIAIADSVILYAGSRTLHDIKSACASEMQFASSHNKPVTVAFIVKSLPDTPSVSFWAFTGSPLSYFNQVVFTGLENVSDGSADKVSAEVYFEQWNVFSGIAIDGYEKSNGYESLAVSSSLSGLYPVQAGSGGSELDFNPIAGDVLATFPGFIAANSGSLNAFIFLDLSGDPIAPYYTMQFDNDSIFHQISIDTATFTNDNDGLIEPLERIKVTVTIDLDLINLNPQDFITQLPLNSLNLELYDENPSTIIIDSASPPSAPLIPDGNNVAITEFTFLIGKVSVLPDTLPLTFRLFRNAGDADDWSILLHSQDQGLELDMNDPPVGQHTSIVGIPPAVVPLGLVLDNDGRSNGVKIISGDAIAFEGWAFDDNDSMAIALRLQKPSETTVIPFALQPTRSIFEFDNGDNITSLLPYWGLNFNARYSVELNSTNAGSISGRYNVLIRGNDGKIYPDNDSDLGTDQFFWNKPPQVTLLLPMQNDTLGSTFEVSVISSDNEIDDEYEAYLSHVTVAMVKEENVDERDNESQIIVLDERMNPNFSSGAFNFSFTFVDNEGALTTGNYFIFARVYDSYGLSAESIIPVTVNKEAPVITRIIPQLGTVLGNHRIYIEGLNLLNVTHVNIGSVIAPVIAPKTDSLLTVNMPLFTPSSAPLPLYVDVELTHFEGSVTKPDGYRFFNAAINQIVQSVNRIGLAYDNVHENIVLLNNVDSTVEIYAENSIDPLTFTFTNDIQLAFATPIKMELSRFAEQLFVIFNGASNNKVEIIDLAAETVLPSGFTIVDPNSEGFSTIAHSLAFITSDRYAHLNRNASTLTHQFLDRLLIGTSGTQAGLYRVFLDPDNQPSGHILDQLLSSSQSHYERIEVAGASNKSTAYILAIDNDTISFELFRYDAFTDSIESIPVSTFPNLSSEINHLNIASNYNGSEFMIYSQSDATVFKSDGTIITSGSAGADYAAFDPLRSTLYFSNLGSTTFDLKSSVNLGQELTYVHFPENDSLSIPFDFDWAGDRMFALTAQGISVLSTGEIYPRIDAFAPQFAHQNDDIEVVISNAGNVTENIELLINNTAQASAQHLSSINDTHTFSVQNPLDNDTSGTLVARVNNYPSEKHDVLMIADVFDKLPANQKNGLSVFAPSSLYIDEENSDLYILDASSTGGLSVIRISIDINPSGTVSVTRLPVPIAMRSFPNPIGIARIHNYIALVSRYSKQCIWFDMDGFDTQLLGDPNNHNFPYQVANMPLNLYPSGIAGYSPSDNLAINYAYIWYTPSSGGLDIFQLNLDSGIITLLQNLASPSPIDIYIDNTRDRAYVSSSQISNALPDFVTVFQPSLEATSIVPITRVFFTDVNKSRPQDLFSSIDYLFVSRYNTRNLSIFAPDESDLNPNTSTNDTHFILDIYQNASKKSKTYSANSEYIAFASANPDNSYSIDILDAYYWNNFPFMEDFTSVYSFTPANEKIFDVEIFNNKLFTIIGRDIVIIDLPIKKED